MKKTFVLFALAFLFVGFSQSQAQLVKLTKDNGASGIYDVWNFHSVLSYDNTVVSATDAKNMGNMFENITFFKGNELKNEWNNVFFHFSGATVTARWTFEATTLMLTNLESNDENGSKYIKFLEGYGITLDHTGVNDGKHFRLNFWNDANGNQKPMYALKFTN